MVNIRADVINVDNDELKIHLNIKEIIAKNVVKEPVLIRPGKHLEYFVKHIKNQI
jgi:ribosomal protein S1